MTTAGRSKARWEPSELEPYVGALAAAERLLERREKQLAQRCERFGFSDVREVREGLEELRTKLRRGPAQLNDSTGASR